MKNIIIVLCCVLTMSSLALAETYNQVKEDAYKKCTLQVSEISFNPIEAIENNLQADLAFLSMTEGLIKQMKNQCRGIAVIAVEALKLHEIKGFEPAK